MSFIKLKQISGPTGESNNGATIVFENNTPKWTSSNTGALLLPSGDTTARPTGLNGHIRYNTETSKVEAYEAGSWKNVISDSELLKRYSFRVNYAGTTAVNSVTNLPDGWSVVSIVSQTVTLTQNTGKSPFAISSLGWDNSIQKYQYRPGTGSFYFRYNPNTPATIEIIGLSPTIIGTSAEHHAYIWLTF